ncbi:MAG TPA: alpha-glucan family phosphorylase [Myxococcota bacterium]|nr:alpha-glucan family phosphorylase [Myxococcota bacterium]HQK50935.1 alpha-glucan family phosphorylase [Myxococcota bacterium]
MKIHSFQVRPRLPGPLEPLWNLANNLWYSWNWDAIQLFIRVDPVLWEECHQNPVAMLGRIPQAHLEELARDESFVATLNRVHERFQRDLAMPGWFQRQHGPEKDLLVAYFSTEYGLDAGLPIYSGGLGVLSGDHLKTASDLGLPLVGIGLLYQKGYFRQVLNPDGWQGEDYPDNDWYNMPVHQERDAQGRPRTVRVDLAGETVTARIWRVQVGRTPLLLLDTNLPENSPRQREVTSTLYGGDRDMRIRQEILLGIGGVRALREMGYAPTVYHMNEGHSAFLVLERLRHLIREEGLSLEAALEVVRATSVFTTHTPVPAGNEVFDQGLVLRYLGPMAQEIGLTPDRLLAMGKDGPQSGDSFGMTVLALHTAAFSNGVSALHGEVAREMWKDLWPGLPAAEVPLHHVTNGIHTRTWVSHDMADLFLRYLGPRWAEDPGDAGLWDKVDTIPDSELWRIHEVRKERLVFFVRKRMTAQARRQGAGLAAQTAAMEVLDPAVLTLGFSRRFATYKRAGLLFRQPDRLVRLLTNPDRPVQIVFAGKAHPQDLPAKELIRSVVAFARDPRLAGHLVFLEDYDMHGARYLVQGVDVWLNTPRRPLEASGTSGMKAAANGALNCSVLDGWWNEGYEPDLGWAIGDGTVHPDAEEQDRLESEALFHLLESEIVPLFYDRDRAGLPREWIRMMKASIRKIGGRFNTHRMLREYTEQAYLPGHLLGRRWHEGGSAGPEALARWRARVSAAWGQVRVTLGDFRVEEVDLGQALEIPIRVTLGDLKPEEVSVEVRMGPLGPDQQVQQAEVIRADPAGQQGSEHLFVARVACRRAGRMGFAARVIPRHPDLLNPLTPLVISWE